jgi:hypothetical protein
MPRDLVTLAQVKRVTGITHDEDNFLLQMYLDQATDTILNYIARDDDEDWTDEIAAWTEETVPGDVKATILKLAAKFYRFRGDSAEGEEPMPRDGFFPDDLRWLLARYRDPVLG